MKNRLDILKRLQMGRMKSDYYKSLFIDFDKIELIGLEESDAILSNINYTRSQTEIIDYTDDFLKSELLKSVYVAVGRESKSYIFTDDYEYCGIFLVDTKEAIEKSLKIAEEDNNHTVFILESDKTFFIRINYYDMSHADFPLKYDIKLSNNSM